MGFAPPTPWRRPRWKHFILSILLLTNLLYVGMIIARSPDTIATLNAQRHEDKNSSPDSTTTIQQDDAVELPLDTSRVRHFKCLGWRATSGCDPNGARVPQKDQNCTTLISYGTSGYCEVEDEDSHERFRVMKRACSRGKQAAVFQCADAPGFANFRVQSEFVVDNVLELGSALPNVNSNDDFPQGIAMVVYPKLAASAYATIRALRDVLNCQLPIEIWYRPDEMLKSPEGLDPLRGLSGDGFVGNLSFEEIEGPQAVGFNTKIYAIYHSKFDQVLFLDADNVPVRDPSYLFETPEFVKTGAVFWPDYWHPDNTIFSIDKDSLVWQLLGTEFVDMFEQESGQILVDRRRHAAPLELVRFYAFHRPDYFNRLKLAWGDKDLFRFAWLKLGTPFHMIESPPAVAGKIFGKSFCGMTMVQHGTTGEVLFLHRNQMKLSGRPRPGQVDDPLMAKDPFPDPVMWTHLLSFRNTSARFDYVIQEHSERQFSTQRRCFGRRMFVENPHFYLREFTEFSFSGLENQLREFAMEAVKLLGTTKNHQT